MRKLTHTAYEGFEAFDPDVPARYGFRRRWEFVMWSLGRHEQDLPSLRKRFFEKVKVVANEAGPE